MPEYQVVEKVFERFGRVWHLTAGGRLIRTTGKHPFYVSGKGWLACKELVAGDRLLCEDGTTVAVEEVVDTGEWETVYNIRVAEWHTYFVGGEGWGWAAWAHNEYTVRHLPAGTDRYSVWNAEKWHVLSQNPHPSSARPDRWVRTADGKAVFEFRSQDAAKTIAQNQQDYEHKAENPILPDDIFERTARGQRRVIRYAEVIVRLDGSLLTEIDFETDSHIYEVGTSFSGKERQLIERCVIARLRGKTVVGIAGASEEGDQKFETYARTLATLTFESARVQTLLRELVNDLTPFTDDKPLSDFFEGFQFI